MTLNHLQHLRGQLLPNESLAKYTSWRVGGPADYVYIPADLNDVEQFLQQIPSDMPLVWLGLGSNVLVRDKGLQGIVIVTQGALSEITQLEKLIVRAEAGVACAQIARYTARLGLTGLEFMAGIPGTVGGALAMNAGCYGGETWQRVQQVETVTRQGEKRIRKAAEFEIAYRHVKGLNNEWFVAGHFELMAGEKESSLSQIRTLLEKRNASQPTGLPNCGSVFRNPRGDFAARLIQECGLKGFSVGGARVSDKHANFIINEADAKAADIEALINKIADTVEKERGVRLQPEVCILGEE